MSSKLTYETMNRPFDANLFRSSDLDVPLGDLDAQGAGTVNSSGVGEIAETPVKSAQSFSDIWIDNSIRSLNWKPKKFGFFINGQTGYAEFSNINISGEITATIGTIGGFTINSTSLSAVAGGNTTTLSSGTTAFSAGPTGSPTISITQAGAVTASNITITGGSVVTSVLSGTIAQTNLNLANRGWTQTSVFSATNATTVAWGAGTFTSADGTNYSISGNNTGVMAARTYIYLDIAVSTTEYQITTTSTSAVGVGKVLIATAINGTTEARFQVFNGIGGLKIPGTDLVNLSINTDQIAASAITTAKIAALAVETSNLAAGAVTTAKIAALNVTAAELATGAVTTAKIAADAVTAAEIAAGAVGSTELAVGAVIAGKITAGTIVSADIAAGTITGSNIAATTITASNIAALTITANEIAASTITGAKIAATTITAANIAALTITAAEIAAGTITGNKIAATTITASNIAALTITAAQIATNTITASQIVAGTITTTEIAANTIVAGNIAASTITGNEIAASTITSGKLSVSQLSAIAADMGSITAGTLSTVVLSAVTGTLDTITLTSPTGHIKAGQTGYDSGTGFYLGYSASTPKFSIGNSAGNKLIWDGSTLTITGAITGSTVTGGTIQTSSSDLRIVLDGTSDELRWMNNSTVYANMSIASYAGGFNVILETDDGDTGGQLGVQNGTVPGSFLQYNGSGIWVDATGVVINPKLQIPVGTNLY